MKKYTPILTVVAAALLGSISASAQSTPTPTPTPPSKWECKNSSRTPEVYSFYGDVKSVIIGKLARIPSNLSERRLFLQVTQGASGEVKLYERQPDGSFTVKAWTMPETSGLLADIDKAIMANKGVNCVGHEVEEILKRLKGGTPVKPVSAGASPQTAFGDSVTNASGDFIKTEVIFLC